MIKTNEDYTTLYFSLVIILSVIASFQLLGTSNDYMGYQIYFTNKYVKMEPFWRPVQWLNINYLNNVNIIFLIFTFISLLFKFYFFYKVDNKYWIYSIFGYILTSFFLHEYTQFRISFAIAVFLIGYKNFLQGNKKKAFITIIICTLIHYSCIILLPFFYFCRIRKLKFYVFIPLCSFCCAIIFYRFFDLFDVLLKILDFLHFRTIRQIVFIKSVQKSSLSYKSLFSLRYLLFVFLITFIYKKVITKQQDKDESLLIAIKAVSFSLTCFYFFALTGLSSLPVRFSEIFLPFYIVLLTRTLHFIREKYIGFLIIFCILLMLSRTYLMMTGFM